MAHLLRSSLYRKVVGCRPAYLLKMSSFTGIFQRFQPQIYLATFQKIFFFRTPFFLRAPPVAACSPSFSEQVSLVASLFMNINKIHGNMKSTSE